MRKRSRMRTKKYGCKVKTSQPLFFLVPEAGIEPALPKEQDFESSASTSSATRAFSADVLTYISKRVQK